MLACGDVVHRLEPVGVVSGALFNSPAHHCGRYVICDGRIKRKSAVDGFL